MPPPLPPEEASHSFIQEGWSKSSLAISPPQISKRKDEDVERNSALRLNDDIEDSKPLMNNFNILLITAVLFGGFALGAIIGALASNSLSLLGDAAAMAVDVFTYLINMYAERLKEKNGSLSPFMRRFLELYVPSFSIVALLSVTAWIASDAIAIITSKGRGEEGDVDVEILFIFASVNFVVDLVSCLLFYVKRKDVLLVHSGNNKPSTLEDHLSELSNVIMPNLNMVSALTHIGSDTLRTISVFAAALVSSVGKQNSSLCDAWAAVVVTFTIIIAVIPLAREIIKAAMNREEQEEISEEEQQQGMSENSVAAFVPI